ncbi:MAG TPA: FAD-binding and (Fe-S)-binding domain-containing protein [Verrucomicrobiae bacterium]|nr:FAD-binding and (Fe-S)-binding domain-containing protein [Verrucomicrobiae bacterium]
MATLIASKRADGIPEQSHREHPANTAAGNGHDGHAKHVDVRALERDLKKNLQGEVRFDRASIGLYATDSSNFREVPLGVVVPKTLDDVVAAHQICSRYGAPICNRGGGTSLSGETVNFAVVIDNSKYLTHIGETNVERKLVTVQTGAINEKVNESTGKQNLLFGPDPSTHAYCTIGGNIGNNSCGIHSVQSQLFGPGPRTSDNVYAMDIVTYEGDRFRVGVNEEPHLDEIIAAGGRKGEIYRQLRGLRDRYADLIRKKFAPVTQVPRRVSGYNLDELLPERGFNVARALVGTEGTCVTALEVTLMLTPAMLKRITVVLQYNDLPDAAEHIAEILEWKPIGLEAVDHQLFENEKLEHMDEKGLEELPRSGKGSWLLIQFGGDSMDQVREHSYRFRDWLVQKKHYAEDRIRIFENDKTSELIWKVREGGLGATAFPPNGKDHWPGWEDSAVPPDKVAPYLRDLRKLYDKFGLNGAIYGHFGQGCIHSRISFNLRSLAGVRQYRKFLDEASDLVVAYGGSLSGEHGDGQQRAEFLHKQYGKELVQAMNEFKRIWDPQWKMNPGKVVQPYPVDAFLKLRNFHPQPVKTKFAYPEDHNDFSHAAIRCVGVGKCRQPEGVDVMCPSYIVTREEKHCTRGRARLLFEMLQGNVIEDGWESKEVYDALDLCLACKGCTSDCPVHVDMPTYKSEFLYHHYQSPKRFRKRYMYAFGFIDQFARLGSLLPEAINFFAKMPGVSNIAKLVTGMDQRRKIPEFAPLTLQSWFRRRGGSKVKTGPPVILWPDTFNNHFHTDVGTACVEALEAAGFRVMMPMQHVCCGRPLYDYGFLDMAEKYLRRTIQQLRNEIRMDIPIVGMEPSCVAVFKDELTKILPKDPDAARLKKNFYHWSEFFQKHEINIPRLNGKAVVWGHCHHKATGGMNPEMKLLKDGMGLEAEEVKGGCCGLAGSWGFESGKYDLSMQCAEVGLLPAARKAEKSTVIVANGFSCKTQLEQSGVGRHALHTAELMRIARKSKSHRLHAQFPERMRDPKPPAPSPVKAARAAAVIGISALTVFALRKAWKALR